jgi:prevent-host-death family protein
MATASTARKNASKRVEVPADQARQQLGDLINRAARDGERIVLTRHGLAVAVIVGIADLEKLEAA